MGREVKGAPMFPVVSALTRSLKVNPTDVRDFAVRAPDRPWH